MQIFQYPYVIITILVFCFITMGLIGLYFTLKSVKTATGMAEKGFCGLSKIENEFDKAKDNRKFRCLVYISISSNSMKRPYPESKIARMYEQIKKILLNCFCVSVSGEICAYGKNNFVALNEMEPKDIESCIDKCTEQINAIFINHGAVNLAHMTFGFVCTSSTEVAFKTALDRAKKACSMAEDKGVLYCRWDSHNGKEFEKKLKIENNIHSEIDNNRFFLEYQPIVDSKTDKLVGAEVLSRLNSHTDGILTPFSFLSAVNNVGLNEKFDYYIFEKNCKWISNDKEKRSEYVYTINFSRSTLCESSFADNIIEIVEKYGCKYSSIAVEILEDKNLTEEERKSMTDNLKRLKEKGMLVFLDDFGTGYTSFSDLADFGINIVKIDRTVSQNATNETGFLILKNIIKTAHDLGMKTLCEGIETEEHKIKAQLAGCDMMQGYYFYRPMPVAQLEKLF